MNIYLHLLLLIEKALRLGAADLSGLEAPRTSHEYEALKETIPKMHRTTSIRKGSEQSMNESRIGPETGGEDAVGTETAAQSWPSWRRSKTALGRRR